MCISRIELGFSLNNVISPLLDTNFQVFQTSDVSLDPKINENSQLLKSHNFD